LIFFLNTRPTHCRIWYNHLIFLSIKLWKTFCIFSSQSFIFFWCPFVTGRKCWHITCVNINWNYSDTTQIIVISIGVGYYMQRMLHKTTTIDIMQAFKRWKWSLNARFLHGHICQILVLVLLLHFVTYNVFLCSYENLDSQVGLLL
jgi:hypothetical protein